MVNDSELQNLIPARALRSLKKGFNAWAGKRNSDISEFNDRLSKLRELGNWRIEGLPAREFYNNLNKYSVSNPLKD